MKRRNFVVASAISLAVPPALAQQKQTAVIGLLLNDSVKPSPYAARLFAALNVKGYTVGGNLRIEDQVGLEGYATMDAGARALVNSKVDIIVANGATATGAAAKATAAIPVVMI